MAFTKVWLDPLVDGVSKLLASKLSQLDTNVSRAIDGTAGGLYTPTSKIEVNDQGIETSKLVLDGTGETTSACTFTHKGIFATSGADSRIRFARINTTRLGDADSFLYDNATGKLDADLYVARTPITATRTYKLPPPASCSAGDRILFRRAAAATGAFAMQIARDDGTVIATTAAAANVNTILFDFHTEGAVTDWFPVMAGGTGVGMSV